MPSIITVAQLRSVLGVSSSLYSDAYLTGIIDTAELTILPLLQSYSNSIAQYRIEDGTCVMETLLPNEFKAGQSVVIGNVATALNGTRTITDTISKEYEFSFAISEADTDWIPVIPAGSAYVSGKDAATLYASNAAIESAITIVSVEVFQSITAAGGQIEGVDFQPTPYRMGRSLANRVAALLSQYRDAAGMVG
jgi:hypothetical protein